MDEFLDEFRTAHAGVGEREKETVANGFMDILRIGDGKTIVAEYLLHLPGTDGIFPGVLHEVDFPLTTETQHLGIAVLRSGGTARRYHVLYAGYEGRTEHTRVVVTLCQGREMPVEELVGDTHQGDALSCIGENLRGRKHEDVVVGISRHGAHEGSLIGV